MSAVKELIRGEADGTVSFGDYTLDRKTKKEDYEFDGDIYKVKTFCEITKLERNGLFVYESVPGTAVTGFAARENGVEFTVEGDQDAQITIGLMDDTDYEVFVDGESIGIMNTGLGGKLSLSVELAAADQVAVKIVKA